MINTILKLWQTQITLIFNLTLAGGAAFIMLVLLPMMYRFQAIEGQENLLAKDISLVAVLSKDHPDPPLILQKDASKVVQEIVDLGNANAITFLSVVNQDKSKLSYKKINTLPINLEIEGTYMQLGLFMGGLNDLSRGIVLVDNFQIKKDAKNTDKVIAKMLLYICLKSTAKAPKAGKDALAFHKEALSFIKDYSSSLIPAKPGAAWGMRNPFFVETIVKEITVDKGKIPVKSEFVYILSGIIWNEEKPSTIINGLVVEDGSAVGPSTVKEIKPDEVILNDGKKDFTLDLRDTERI